MSWSADSSKFAPYLEMPRTHRECADSRVQDWSVLRYEDLEQVAAAQCRKVRVSSVSFPAIRESRQSWSMPRSQACQCRSHHRPVSLRTTTRQSRASQEPQIRRGDHAREQSRTVIRDRTQVL
uniref:Uncharacterized protein n=1 Tax=Knipowitschia caucasica TaxID=637954 RepID=A0AAV2KUU6_KNICA